MRVLHIIPSLSSIRGGPSQVTIELVKSLNLQGIQAEVATTNDHGSQLLDVPLAQRTVYQGIPVYFFKRFSPPYSAIREFAFSWQFTQWLWKCAQSYDLIHIHAVFSYTSTFGMVLAQLLNVPYVISPHGLLCQWSLTQARIKKKTYLKLLERQNINHARAILYSTAQEQAEAKSLDFSSSCVVMPFGLTPVPQIQDARGQLRDYLSLSENAVILLFLGRLHPKKGLDFLIPALNKVKAVNSSVHFVLAGDGDPAYQDWITHQLHKFDIADISHCVGFVDGHLKNILLEGSDLFALTSYSENFGVAVLEALAAGTPVLLTPGVALASAIEKYQVGYLVPQDITSITNAIEKYLSLSQLEKDNLSQKARKFVIENYSWDKIAIEMLTVYRWILQQGPQPECVVTE